MMMKNFTSYLILAVATLFFVACTKTENDSIPPKGVSGLSATPMNQAVQLTWVNPVDEDFDKTKIIVESNIVEIPKDYNSVLIENMENGKEYLFEISTCDVNGNYSESITIKCTPYKYVTSIIGREIESGTYDAVHPTFPVGIVVNGNQYKRTMQAGGTKYIWEGTWQKTNDTTYTYNYEYYTDDYRGIIHVANMVDKYNSAFCFDFKDTTFAVEEVYEKLEGPAGFITGKYMDYRKTTSDDEPSYNDTTHNFVTFTNDGVATYNNDGTIETSNWDNQDLLDGKYLFVNINSRIYLIDRKKKYVFAKQK